MTAVVERTKDPIGPDPGDRTPEPERDGPDAGNPEGAPSGATPSSIREPSKTDV